MKRSLLVPLLVLGFPLAACTAPTASAPSEAPPKTDDALIVRTAGLRELLADPRDAGLLRALEMLDERVLELPVELHEEDVPASAIDFALDVLFAPLDLRADLDPNGGWTNGPPVLAQLEVHEDVETADALASRLGLMLTPLSPDPQADAHGLRTIPTPAGIVHFGATGTAPKRLLLSWGEPALEPLELGPLDLPRGVEPTLFLALDFARLGGAIETLLAMGGEQVQTARKQLELFGIIGERPLALTAVLGLGEDRAHGAVRIANARAHNAALGALAEGSLSREDLALVPRDASLASLTMVEPTYLAKLLRTMTPPESDPFTQVETLLGLNVEHDLLEPLGTKFGFYASETSGGGGFASMVLFVSVDDEKKLLDSLDHLAGLVNDLSDAHAQGRVWMREWDRGASPAWTLVFPGLPIPLELSAALQGGRLFVAATPQALEAALRQQESGEGLDENDDVHEFAGDLEGVVSFSYQDTERLARGGYGWLCGLASALANAVRSPLSDARDPGMVLPPFEELVRGARPSIAVSRYEGDDLVARSELDRSVAANAAAFLGTPFTPLVLVGVGAGAIVPQIVKSRMAAEQEMRETMERMQSGEELDEILEQDADEGQSWEEDEESEDEGAEEETPADEEPR